MKITSIYIPRILGSFNETIIQDIFENQLNIGRVLYIDMHKKINDKNKSYFFAFINLELYDTPNAKHMEKKLDDYGFINITYNPVKNYYWVIKKHVQKDLRKSPSFMMEDEGYFSDSSITQKEKEDLEREYDELQREIFSVYRELIY